MSASPIHYRQKRGITSYCSTLSSMPVLLTSGDGSSGAASSNWRVGGGGLGSSMAITTAPPQRPSPGRPAALRALTRRQRPLASVLGGDLILSDGGGGAAENFRVMPENLCPSSPAGVIRDSTARICSTRRIARIKISHSRHHGVRIR